MKTKGSSGRFYYMAAEAAVKELHSDARKGLSATEAAARLREDGYNEFEKKKKKSVAVKFLEQFRSFMIIVLLIAAAISGVVGYMHGEGFTDAIIILAIVVLNAVIGVMQEMKAERSLEALEKMSAPFSKVVRDGQVTTVPSREIVPGDVVVLETGDLVPADIRLTEAVNLKIQEASLTGESVPVEKDTAPAPEDAPLGDRHGMAYSSTLVSYGRGQGIAVATAMNTEVGKIAGMLQSVPEVKTPLQKRIDQLGKYLGAGALGICILIFVIGILQGRELLSMFMTAVSLAAAAIPEGLPAVTTIVLAVGVQRLARRHAIVRSLPSVETLGSTGVICSDKTGTLTQNRMTVVRLYSDGISYDIPESLSPEQHLFLKAYILANDGKLTIDRSGWHTTGDPTETAFLDLGMKLGLDKNTLETENARMAEIPFDSERKMMSTVNRGQDGSLTVYAKGGVDEVLACCTRILSGGKRIPLTEAHTEDIRRENTLMAGNALRVLAAAYKETDPSSEEENPGTVETGLTFLGLAGMIDPPREEVKGAVLTCRSAGIKPVMITGDHKITAVAIAEALDIMRPGDKALTGAELDETDDGELSETIDDVSVYARVSPEHKVRIVKAFQKKGRIVAMTGDGVNDAPALKLADIGVAMGITGTDVSKEAADIVLTDDNFATIVTSVEEGRRIYDNILKAIQFLLSTNIGEVLVIFIAIICNWATPLLPIQILWINLVTDSLPALALSVDPAEPGIMERKPADAKRSILSGQFLWRIMLQGAMIGGLSLAAFRIGMQTSLEVAHTMTFAVLAFTQITHALNVRTSRHSAFRGMFNNGWLWAAIAVVVALMFAVLLTPGLHGIFHVAPIDTVHWMWIAGLSVAPLVIVELAKGLLRLIHR